MTKKKNDISIKDESFMKDRVLFMEQEFNEDSVNKLKRQLLYLLADDPKKEITIYISSYGGSVYEFLSVYDIISTAKCKFTTIALGKCMSAGAYLLLMGDTRVAYPTTRIMLHELAHSISYKKLHDSKNSIREAEELQNILTDIVSNKTNIDDAEQYLTEDQYINPEKALELGIIDKIVE